MGYSPTITTSSPIVTVYPSVSTAVSATITSPTVSYNQILNSLGAFVYGGEFIYLYSENPAQVSLPLGFSHNQINGNKVTTYYPNATDAYQAQNASYIETDPEGVMFDSMSALSFLLLSNTSLYFKLFSKVTANTLYLDEVSPDAFEQSDNVMGDSFFKDYCNYLFDEEDS